MLPNSCCIFKAKVLLWIIFLQKYNRFNSKYLLKYAKNRHFNLQKYMSIYAVWYLIRVKFGIIEGSFRTSLNPKIIPKLLKIRMFSPKKNIFSNFKTFRVSTFGTKN